MVPRFMVPRFMVLYQAASQAAKTQSFYDLVSLFSSCLATIL